MSEYDGLSDEELRELLQDTNRKIANLKKFLAEEQQTEKELKKEIIEKEYQQKQLETKIETLPIPIEDIFTTRIVTFTDEVITNIFRVKDTNGQGVIDQFLIESPTNSFQIYILIDDKIIFNKEYTYFSTYNDYLTNVSAFYDSDTSKYYLSMRNLYFQKNFRINIITTTSVTFDEILLKYKIRDEQDL